MTTTKQILKALAVPYVYYDNLREMCFQKWAEKYSRKFAIPLRAICTHDGLWNWYCDNWIRSVEMPFCKMYGDFFGKSDEVLLERLLMEFPETILDVYPAPILEMIKNESHDFNHHTIRRADQSA